MLQNDDIFQISQIFLDISASNQNEVFEQIAQQAAQLKIISNNSIKKIVAGFHEREKVGSTGFEDGFAIPHVLLDQVKRPSVFFVRLKKAIDWKSFDKKLTNIIIAICVPKKASTQHLDILAQIARSLTDENIRKILKTAKSKEKILNSLVNMSETPNNEFVIQNNDNKNNNDKGLIVGVSSCTTGVVHTYMAKEQLEKFGQELGYQVHIECQGQKGQEFALTSEEINRAEVIILANDVGIDMERFVGKNVFQSSAITATDKPREVIEQALKNKKIYGSKQDEVDFIQSSGKGKAPILRHLLSGVSYLIPFVVFAGLTFAIIGGIAHGLYGNNFAFQGTWEAQLTWLQKNNSSPTETMYALFIINSIANIGFNLMIPIMGAFIAFSIAGRPAIAPAMIVTYLLVNPSINLWWDFNGIFNLKSSSQGQLGSSANSWTLFGALYGGLIEGYFVKWVNSWKTPKWLSPIMPIIIIPFFCTLILIVPTAFLIAAPFGYVMGEVDYGLSWMGKHPNIGFIVGLILGGMVGFDLGGPINKTAVLVATSLMSTDNGRLMGTVAAAIPIAPWGAALTSTVFARKYFTKQEKALGTNAWILGFMGISESSIPFAVRDTWRAIVPNVIASALAGALAFLFNLQGHVGAWGGYIIALFGGVTDTSGSFIGILWYLIAIAIATVVHSLIYTSLLLHKESAFQNIVIKINNSFKKSWNKIFKKSKLRK